jgi:outer membrane biosynthesis protein TonB
LLGDKVKSFTVTLDKPKPPEKPPVPVKPPETPKIAEPPKTVEPPKIVETAPAPSSTAPPAVAPPPTELPSFDVGGGHEVISGDPVQVYKGYMEYTLRSKWDKPEDMDDDNYVVEMGVTVDKNGRLGNSVMEKSSGNKKWDDSVKQVFNVVKTFDRTPPTNFPPNIIIRFDVQVEDASPMFQ